MLIFKVGLKMPDNPKLYVAVCQALSPLMLWFRRLISLLLRIIQSIKAIVVTLVVHVHIPVTRHYENLPMQYLSRQKSGSNIDNNIVVINCYIFFVTFNSK